MSVAQSIDGTVSVGQCPALDAITLFRSLFITKKFVLYVVLNRQAGHREITPRQDRLFWGATGATRSDASHRMLGAVTAKADTKTKQNGTGLRWSISVLQ